MRRRRFVPWTVAAGSLVVLGAVASLAGPLDPPAGPVAPTYKTLAEVEPRIAVNATNTPGNGTNTFRITQPGSYYLTGNITREAAKNGISIEAGGVTLDLMGFSLIGVPGSLDGITVGPPGLTSIAVVNGSVETWGSTGVDLGTAINHRLERLRARANGGFYGIHAGDAAQIIDCTATFNLNYGFLAGIGCSLSNCTAGSNGTNGIAVGAESAITSCASIANGTVGISAGQGSTVSNCTAANSGADGINLGPQSTIANCSVHNNALNGINVSFGSSVSGCASRLNGTNGFNITSGGSITGCSAQSNTMDGILVSGESFIRGNVCDSNGVGAGDGAGIHTTFGDNRIEGNSCTRNDRGIDVDAAGNIVVRNTCSGNTMANWAIIAGNAVAPIVQATTNAAAISGNTYTGSLGSTDPNANFTY